MYDTIFIRSMSRDYFGFVTWRWFTENSSSIRKRAIFFPPFGLSKRVLLVESAATGRNFQPALRVAARKWWRLRRSKTSLSKPRTWILNRTLSSNASQWAIGYSAEMAESTYAACACNLVVWWRFTCRKLPQGGVLHRRIHAPWYSNSVTVSSFQMEYSNCRRPSKQSRKEILSFVALFDRGIKKISSSDFAAYSDFRDVTQNTSSLQRSKTTATLDLWNLQSNGIFAEKR